MYNRYVPQPDGSFRRSRVPDTHYPHQQPVQERPIQESHPQPESECCAPQPQPTQNTDRREPRKPTPYPRSRQYSQQPQNHQQRSQNNRQQRQEQPFREHQEQNRNQLNSFFKNLLPKDFDTTDLLIVLLLLLMAGDCHEDQNSALLTLALYFFM